jgi:hypothetical protein
VGVDEPYGIVDGQELEQGDFVKRCPVYVPEYIPTIAEETDAEKTIKYSLQTKEYTFNVVVMTQSCDLRPDKISFVVLCPYWSLEEMIARDENLRPKKMQEKIRQGYIPNYHMLHECRLSKMPHGIQIVDFRLTFTMPFNFLTQFAESQGERLRLLSPYKEKLSHAFGHFFSRVGLPQDIPPFTK